MLMSALAVVAIGKAGHGQSSKISDWPQTRAERTNYAETSHYADVIDFIHGLQAAGAPVRLQYIGTTTEGFRMPLMVVSRTPVTSSTQARRLGKPVVYIQANIHAGEVEGKEAILHLVRKYCQDPTGVLDKIVLLVDPIYNIDGNEKFGPQNRNRPGQGGPEMIGVRANGQGLDLNRDYIKAETPEFNASLTSIFTAWDPDVMMDLHTTDGTRHGYALTYAPPLSPITASPVQEYVRDTMLPTIRKNLRSKFGLETFDYGNAERRGNTMAWYEVGPEGRYSTNYVGLRNRIGILSEALTYPSFKDRVVSTERFTDAVIQWVASKPKEIVQKSREADANVIAWGLDPSKAPPMGVRFEPLSRGVEGLLIEKKTAKHEGVPIDLETVKMDVYDRFKASKTEPFPAAYVIPSGQSKTADLLVKHGVRVEKFVTEWAGNCETFTVESFHQDGQPFQGHKLQSLEGTFRQQLVTAHQGDFLVRTSQPLGILIFHIMEPESLDGALAWGFMGDKYAKGDTFPAYKAMKPVTAVTEKYQGD